MTFAPRSTERNASTVVAILGLTLCLAVACQPQRAPQAEQPLINPADVAFGYTDSTGSKLLMLTDDNHVMEIAKAKSMDTAVCSDGREFPIRYLDFQKSSPANNGRQSAGNFNNDQGHLYEIVGERTGEGDSCLLVPSGYLKAFPIIRSESTHRELSKETTARIEKEKGRTVKGYKLLHSAGASQQVAAIEFDAMGDSLLGSVVLAEPDRLSFFDMPANLKDGRARGGCWRVDDDCRFNSEEMGVPIVLGAADEPLVFFTSGGPEGQNIILFQAKGGKLVELRRAYRYQAPL